MTTTNQVFADTVKERGDAPALVSKQGSLWVTTNEITLLVANPLQGGGGQGHPWG